MTPEGLGGNFTKGQQIRVKRNGKSFGICSLILTLLLDHIGIATAWTTQSSLYPCDICKSYRSRETLFPIRGAVHKIHRVLPHNNIPQRYPTSTAVMGDITDGEEQEQSERGKTEKRLIFIRHGCSYMNEYIAHDGVKFGRPGFTDIFSPEDNEKYYRDSPLSPTGEAQAKDLADFIGKVLKESDDTIQTNCLKELELIVVSPLTRAIQTAELALLPHIWEKDQNFCSSVQQPRVPVVALPLAAERLYLVSDIGRPRSELQRKFGYFVDFNKGFTQRGQDNLDDPWWFSFSEEHHGNYLEWRPIGEDQRYFCRGEPEDIFRQRMADFCKWLDERPETTIALVGHFGTFEFLLKQDNNHVVKFANCEMKVVPFSEIRTRMQTIR
jgi:broad specificity phosphatase PhoE